MNNVLKDYQQQIHEIIGIEEQLENLIRGKITIEAEINSLNKKLSIAESDKKKGIERLALGEIQQSEYEDIKNVLVQVQKTIQDRQDMSSVLGTKIQELKNQLNGSAGNSGMRQKAKETKGDINDISNRS